MQTSKLSLTILIISATVACKQKTSTATNMAALKATDTALILKPEQDSITANKTAPEKQLIIPGKSIGRIRIGESMDSIYKVLGRPDSTDAAMGSSLAVWFANHNTSGYRTSVFAHHNYGGKDEATQFSKKILVTSPYFKTADGIGNGSTIDAIKQKYNLKKGKGYQQNNKQIDVYADLAKGISFEIDPATNKCVSILVHRPNEQEGAYINMH